MGETDDRSERNSRRPSEACRRRRSVGGEAEEGRVIFRPTFIYKRYSQQVILMREWVRSKQATNQASHIWLTTKVISKYEYTPHVKTKQQQQLPSTNYLLRPTSPEDRESSETFCILIKGVVAHSKQQLASWIYYMYEGEAVAVAAAVEGHVNRNCLLSTWVTLKPLGTRLKTR